MTGGCREENQTLSLSKSLRNNRPYKNPRRIYIERFFLSIFISLFVILSSRYVIIVVASPPIASLHLILIREKILFPNGCHQAKKKRTLS